MRVLLSPLYPLASTVCLFSIVFFALTLSSSHRRFLHRHYLCSFTSPIYRYNNYRPISYFLLLVLSPLRNSFFLLHRLSWERLTSQRNTRQKIRQTTTNYNVGAQCGLVKKAYRSDLPKGEKKKKKRPSLHIISTVCCYLFFFS